MNEQIIKNISHTAVVDQRAEWVVQQLQNAGYRAYLVGGCVRDLLLGRVPKDFDIATDAAPEVVRKIFPHCILIGRRFLIARVRVSGTYFEVTTFRANTTIEEEHQSEHGILLADNVYGQSVEEDAVRRDFTVNALYYDPIAHSVVDCFGGLEDLDKNLLRSIGDPIVRFREDPVRILRAIRFSAKLNFRLDSAAISAIHELKDLLLHVPPARLYLEIQKLFLAGHAQKGFELLQHNQLLTLLLPYTQHSFTLQPEKIDAFIQQALVNTDIRIRDNRPVTTVFLLAVLLWYPMRDQMAALPEKYSPQMAMQHASQTILRLQGQIFSIPKRIQVRIIEIWRMQYPLVQRNPRHITKMLQAIRFRAAYDFLLLCAAVDSDLAPIAQWWTEIQTLSAEEQQARIMQLPKPRRHRKRRAK